MTALESLVPMVQEAGWAYALVFFRIGAMMAVLPGFGERSVPQRIRLGIALAFTAIVAPALWPLDELPEPALAILFWYLLTETCAGLILGLALRLAVMALQIAGSIAAQATSLSQLFGGAAGEPLPTLSHIFTVSALALMMITGLHVKVAELLIFSYGPLPLGALPGPSVLGQWGTAQVAEAFALAFSLAAPFVVLSALYNLTLGVINKAMPQLMVTFVGAPVITFGAVAMMALATPMLLSIWLARLDLLLVNPFGPR
ncbi:flagellar biosynthetic protein FliR [Litorisediminicola beolgyonensis]|uniref:Flagellar biosynthetic protein FliR n=1 Tax=Litorisediminicola beolgyonensis TaxID=1173614 RepID=A0ABW3ZGI5_9RHOB